MVFPAPFGPTNPQTDPAGMAGGEPSHLFGQLGGRPERQQDRGGRGPTHWVLLQNERGHLQRIGQVAGEAAMVLAGHDAVEAGLEGDPGLGTELGHDGRGRELVVGIEAE